MFRIARISAELNLARGDISNAKKDLEEAMQFIGEDLKRTNYLADIYSVKADTLYADGKYQEALRYYQDADEIYLEQYDNKIEIRKFSELYEKIVDVALMVDELAIAQRYYKIHFDNFGEMNTKTEALLKKVQEYKIKSERKKG